MAQTWWPRSSDYATCSTTREADSTAVTDLRDIDILSRAPQPCARFISTIISSLSASSNPPLLTDYTKGSRPTTTSTPVWMEPIRPLIVSEIENFERKEWKILSHDHISPYLTGTCDVVIRRTSRASGPRKPHRDRAISGPKRPARIARSQEPPSETLRKFAHKRGTYVC